MNVLVISGDVNLLKEGSAAHARLALQRSQVDQLAVFVWPQVHSVRAIIRDARGKKVDVVTVQDPFWRGLIGLWVARRLRAALNVQLHTDFKMQPWWRRLLGRWVLARADAIRVVSRQIEQDISAFHLRAPVTVLPVYIDLEPFRSVTHRTHPRFEKTIGWFGRFESEKDPEAAVEILKGVRAAGIDVGLVMQGAGRLEGQLRACAAAAHGAVEIIEWGDPREMLSVADVVVCTSRHESYGASIIEALAAGVPVVAPDVGVARAAGATVVERSQLTQAVVEALTHPKRGELALAVLSADDWAVVWRQSLTTVTDSRRAGL